MTGSNPNSGVELVPVPLCPPQRQPPTEPKKEADIPSQHDVAAGLCLLVGAADFLIKAYSWFSVVLPSL